MQNNRLETMHQIALRRCFQIQQNMAQKFRGICTIHAKKFMQPLKVVVKNSTIDDDLHWEGMDVPKRFMKNV